MEVLNTGPETFEGENDDGGKKIAPDADDWFPIPDVDDDTGEDEDDNEEDLGEESV